MKYLKELFALGFTLGGTGLVLLTLSGSTLTWAIWISLASLVLHMVAVGMPDDEE